MTNALYNFQEPKVTFSMSCDKDIQITIKYLALFLKKIDDEIVMVEFFYFLFKPRWKRLKDGGVEQHKTPLPH